jgi:hypothetical protein
VYGTFLDVNNPTRDKPMHMNIMDKAPKDTNQRTPSQGVPCTFPFFGNLGAPLMPTLNILDLNVELSVWLCTTFNVMNAHDVSQISTLCQENQFDPLHSLLVNSMFPPFVSSS